MSKIYESKIFDIRKKKNREKNFSFQRFLLNSMFFVLSREGYGVIPSEGPEARSRGICLQLLNFFLRQA